LILGNSFKWLHARLTWRFGGNKALQFAPPQPGARSDNLSQRRSRGRRIIYQDCSEASSPELPFAVRPALTKSEEGSAGYGDLAIMAIMAMVADTRLKRTEILMIPQASDVQQSTAPAESDA
jgi:hypothetical protein